ncbi:peptidoglycan-binding domain-containing protein [Bacillus licheniformis]|uniref:peptidoglycan-binding domain-containing protein n=1 Tax=Bacillus licheniformis TaxID=1402 RepID=UPI0022823825|nr:peptidoglycan-binding domain-containing protein [Bacillus licheniformis]MCY8020574.1 peptidoglycan-binding protein [Bacillus licheniformis]
MPIPPYKNQAKTTSSTSQSSKPTGTILKKGSSGSQVKALQKRLIAAGFSLPKYGADGSYGNETVQAVKALQKKAGIAVDGIYGPATKRRSQLLKRKRKSLPQAAKNHPTRCRLASIR